VADCGPVDRPGFFDNQDRIVERYLATQAPCLSSSSSSTSRGLLTSKILDLAK
jgi:hypothetical protein